MSRRAWLAGGAAVAAALIGLLWWLGGGLEYRRETTYNNVKLTIASSREAHPSGAAIPVRLMATNTGSTTFVYDTATDGPLSMPTTPAGLGPPRPAYDLLFLGYYIDGANNRHEFTWVWSEQGRSSPVPARVEIKPGETRELLKVTWQPPTAQYMQGYFIGRFGNYEFPTGVRIQEPRR